jgi:hypothetical protein
MGFDRVQKVKKCYLYLIIQNMDYILLNSSPSEVDS